MKFRFMHFENVPEWPYGVVHNVTPKDVLHLTQLCGVFFRPGLWEVGPHGWRFKREREAGVFSDMIRAMEKVQH